MKLVTECLVDRKNEEPLKDYQSAYIVIKFR